MRGFDGFVVQGGGCGQCPHSRFWRRPWAGGLIGWQPSNARTKTPAAPWQVRPQWWHSYDVRLVPCKITWCKTRTTWTCSVHHMAHIEHHHCVQHTMDSHTHYVWRYRFIGCMAFWLKLACKLLVRAQFNWDGWAQQICIHNTRNLFITYPGYVHKIWTPLSLPGRTSFPNHSILLHSSVFPIGWSGRVTLGYPDHA